MSTSWRVHVTKLDAEKRRVFGDALICRTSDGRAVVDLQGDMVEPEDMEEAAYDFVQAPYAALDEIAKRVTSVLSSGVTKSQMTDEIIKVLKDFMDLGQSGEMHEGAAKGRLIESMAFTPEKMAALGIPSGIRPVSHFVGFEVPQATFEKVKAGQLLDFSVEGKGDRIPVAA